MAIETIKKVGKNFFAPIPGDVVKKIGLKNGSIIDFRMTTDGHILLIPKDPPHEIADSEFEKWLEVVLKENDDILKELAKY